MPVEIPGFLKHQLDKWTRQALVDMQEYQLILPGIQWSSVTICGIDGLLWTSYPTKQVENIAGRFLYNGQEYKWIVPGHSLAQSIGNARPEGQAIPGGVKIPEGVQEHDALSLALTEIHQENLKRMSFEIQIHPETLCGYYRPADSDLHPWRQTSQNAASVVYGDFGTM